MQKDPKVHFDPEKNIFYPVKQIASDFLQTQKDEKKLDSPLIGKKRKK